jgi:hypothetical protein
VYLFAILYLLHSKHCSKETGTKPRQDHPGGPGMTSSMLLLFSDNPSEVIRKALWQLKIEMKVEQGKSQP